MKFKYSDRFLTYNVYICSFCYIWPLWKYILFCSIIQNFLLIHPIDGLAVAPKGISVVSCWNKVCKLSETSISDASADQEVKILCGGQSSISDFHDFCTYQMLPATKVLEIVNTSVSIVPSSAFSNLVNLRRLSLRNNEIEKIEPAAFIGLSSLKRLDISHNRLTFLNGSQFYGLDELVRLKLGHNPIVTFHSSVAEALPALRAVELTETALRCDCDIAWLLFEPKLIQSFDAAKNAGDESSRHDGFGVSVREKSFRILGNPSCGSPGHLSSVKLKQLTLKQLICDKKKENDINYHIEISPNVNQIAFAGDNLKLSCIARTTLNISLSWRSPLGSTEDFFDTIENFHVGTLSKHEFYESILDIPALKAQHTGQWSCVADNDQDVNISQSIGVYVIHNGTKYCPENVTSDDKGTYNWPRSVDSVTVELSCQGSDSLLGVFPQPIRKETATSPRLATHYCSPKGTWSNLNTSRCPFVSETTRILEHFATSLVLRNDSSSLMNSAQNLLNFTSKRSVPAEPADVHYIAKAVERYGQRLSQNSHPFSVARVLLDVIASVSQSTEELLKSAENMFGSCSSVLSSLWDVVDRVPMLATDVADAISVTQFPFLPETFNGLKCLWFRQSKYSRQRHLSCSANASVVSSEIRSDFDAEIEIPADALVSNVSSGGNVSLDNLFGSIARFQVFMYGSSKLFQSEETENSWVITSPVVGLRLNENIGLKVKMVYVTLRSHVYSRNLSGVIWRPGLAGNGSKWEWNNCEVIRIYNSLIKLNCSAIGHYGVIQDMTAFKSVSLTNGAKFKWLPLPIYIGSFVCSFFLMVSIVVWVSHHRSIGTMSKNKHSFVNTWLALLFLIAFFTSGIHQTELLIACQIIGLILHYFSMCVILWIIVSVTNLYKKITKVFRPPSPSDDSPVDAPMPPKPMVRFYLVGWGIALIVCGISAAVNLRHYATYSYCFLAWNPSIAAFYIPSGVLILTLVVVFVLTNCLLCTTSNGEEIVVGHSEATELDALDGSPSPLQMDRRLDRDDRSIISQVSNFASLDAQHSPLTLLRAHTVTLILYILTWASGAMTSASPFSSLIPYHSLIFSIIYAICASSLGIFIFVFFCICRNDIKFLGNFSSLPNEPSESSVVAVFQNHENSPLPPTNGELVADSQVHRTTPSVRSNGSSLTNPTNKSSQTHSTSEKNGSLQHTTRGLKLLAYSGFTHTVDLPPEVFYNPRQAGVAKRFFQKQRLRQMIKQNNLQMNDVDSDCNSTFYKPKKINLNQSVESDSALLDINKPDIYFKEKHLSDHPVDTDDMRVDFISSTPEKYSTPIIRQSDTRVNGKYDLNNIGNSNCKYNDSNGHGIPSQISSCSSQSDLLGQIDEESEGDSQRISTEQGKDTDNLLKVVNSDSSLADFPNFSVLNRESNALFACESNGYSPVASIEGNSSECSNGPGWRHLLNKQRCLGMKENTSGKINNGTSDYNSVVPLDTFYSSVNHDQNLSNNKLEEFCPISNSSFKDSSDFIQVYNSKNSHKNNLYNIVNSETEDELSDTVRLDSHQNSDNIKVASPLLTKIPFNSPQSNLSHLNYNGLAVKSPIDNGPSCLKSNGYVDSHLTMVEDEVNLDQSPIYRDRSSSQESASSIETDV